MAYIGTTVPLPLLVLYNVCVDTIDEKFVPFIQGFQNCILSIVSSVTKTWTVMKETQQVSE
jgi:hypothetical protein